MNEMLVTLKYALNTYCPIPEAEWDYIARGLKAERIMKGEYYVRIGDPTVKACFVIKGIFKAHYLDAQGNEYVRSFTGPHNFLAPLSSGLRGVPCNISIRAIQDCEILTADYAHWRSAIGRHPCWDEIHRKVAERFYIDREEHVIELLTMPAIERYRRFLDRFPELAPSIPQKDIAAYIGITPVALSRMIAKEP